MRLFNSDFIINIDIWNQSFVINLSIFFMRLYVKSGTNCRLDTPPLNKYKRGVVYVILSICNSGNFLQKISLSLMKTIQGIAPFAPERGPSAGICLSPPV